MLKKTKYKHANKVLFESWFIRILDQTHIFYLLFLGSRQLGTVFALNFLHFQDFDQLALVLFFIILDTTYE